MQFRILTKSALETLERNLAVHIEELKEAQEEWTAQMIGALERFRDAIDRVGLRASLDEIHKLSYSRPKDNRVEYSKFIGAMRMSLGDIVEHYTEMDEDEYDMIFNDNFSWRRESKMSNASYTKG
jgi:hypothetical protein